MTTPALSVLIDSYNHERYIEQAILSILAQDYPASDMEILVVDDGSTDHTPEIVHKFAPRVRLLRKKNGGQASAFNAAFPELKGEVISFLDGDDWFAPGKLTAVMAALEHHPEATAASHGYYEFRQDTGQQVTRAPLYSGLVDLSKPEIAATFFGGLSNCVQMGALTVRRPTWRRVHPIDERLVFCGDNPIVMSSLAGGTYILEAPFFHYRFHSDNLCATSHVSPERSRRRFDIYEKMVEVMEPLLQRLGVPSDSVAALLHPYWRDYRRPYLRMHGGNRLDTLRTELGCFRSEFRNAPVSYRVFKYTVVCPMALLLGPLRFYHMRDWYGSKNLGRLRQHLFKAASGTNHAIR